MVGRWVQELVTADVGDPVAVAVLAAVAVLVAAVGVGVLRSTRRSAARRPAAASAAEVGRNPAQWRADAERAASAAQWRTALRCWYRATVAELAAGGLVAERPGATTGEDLASVRARAPRAAPAFAELTDAFERAWYGRAAVDADDVAAVRAAAAQVSAAIRAPRRLPAVSAER